MLEYKPIKFPADELPHKNIIEWWYFNGHLFDAAGRHYAFMDCLFKVNPKKVKIPFLRGLPFNEAYFSHAMLSDMAADKFYSEINPLVFVSKDSFSKDSFFVNYAAPSLKGYFNYEIEKIDANRWHLKTPYFDLTLKNKKPPLLVGGNGFVDLQQNSTYYYSLTDLEATGEVIVNGHRIAVKGQGWADHQWADAVYSNFRWTWFSLQLKNQTEIVCFCFENKKQITNLACIIGKSGEQKTFYNVEFEALGDKWQSSDTGTDYPLAWRLKIKEAKLDLVVRPLSKKQEIIFGLINYWEGGTTVEGTQAKSPVSGLGFMELVGYPSKKSRLNFYQRQLRQKIQSDLKRIFSK